MVEMLLTPEQAAMRLQVHPETVRRQCASGKLRALKRGRLWRIPESALTDTAPRRQWKEDAETIETHYAHSLATGGDLTAFSDAQEDVHEYSAGELAAMERGEFERPQR